MEYHSREVKAGLLVILSLLAFAAFIFTITKIDWERKEKTFTARFDYIGGIDRGAMVRFGGFLIGTVTDLYIAPDDNSKIEIVLTVDSRAPVRKDSESFITTIGIMGESYIEITPGTNEEELLGSGARLRTREVPALNRLSEPFMDVSKQLALLLVQANDLLNDANRRRFSNMLANADSLLGDNASEISGIVSNLNALTFQMQNFSAKLDKLMGENAQTLDTTMASLNVTLTRIDTLLQSLNETMQVLNDVALTNQTNLHGTMENLERATNDFAQFSRTLKERPWNLIRKSSPPERKLPD